MRTVLVSSCLLGLSTRYDGKPKENLEVRQFIEKNGLIPVPVCPEQLGGLPTPRPRCCFLEGDGDAVLQGWGRLKSERGDDPTEAFLKGAEQTLKIADICKAKMAILQQRSPSCGRGRVYIEDRLTTGNGVTAALLKEHNLRVFSDDDLPPEKI